MRPQPNLSVVRRLAAVPATETFTSSITYGELIFGASRVARRDLLERIEGLPAVLPVLAFDESAARRFGDLKAELERGGTPLAEPDLRIAAIALAKGLTLVTGNQRHFRRVPRLTIEDWLT